MAETQEYKTQVASNLRRLKLTLAVIDEVHKELVHPETPDDKADLLIQVEQLAEATFTLLMVVRGIAWGTDTPTTPTTPTTTES